MEPQVYYIDYKQLFYSMTTRLNLSGSVLHQNEALVQQKYYLFAVGLHC